VKVTWRYLATDATRSVQKRYGAPDERQAPDSPSQRRDSAARSASWSARRASPASTATNPNAAIAITVTGQRHAKSATVVMTPVAQRDRSAAWAPVCDRLPRRQSTRVRSCQHPFAKSPVDGARPPHFLRADGASLYRAERRALVGCVVVRSVFQCQRERSTAASALPHRVHVHERFPR